MWVYLTPFYLSRISKTPLSHLSRFPRSCAEGNIRCSPIRRSKMADLSGFFSPAVGSIKHDTRQRRRGGGGGGGRGPTGKQFIKKEAELSHSSTNTANSRHSSAERCRNNGDERTNKQWNSNLMVFRVISWTSVKTGTEKRR